MPEKDLSLEARLTNIVRPAVIAADNACYHQKYLDLSKVIDDAVDQIIALINESKEV